MAGLQGSSISLQGGTGISLGNYNPQSATRAPAQKAAPKPAAPQVSYGGSNYGGGGGYAAPAPVVAPRLDLAQVNAQARAAAESAVNPYYTKTLNDFLAQQSAQKQQQQQVYDTSVKNLQDTMKHNLEENTINRGRTAEDTGIKEADINHQGDIYQTDQGKQFDTARRTQAVDLAKAGLTTSGLGQGQVVDAQTQHNIDEQNQVDQFQQQKNAAELLKGRTFEDLARSDVLSQEAETKGEKQSKFDLDTFIQNLGFSENSKRNELDIQRQQDIASKVRDQSKLIFNNWLNTISNPQQRLAAVQMYGGSF